MEAYIHGVSTRKVDDLVAALGAESGISKSEVSRICADLDTDVTAFNTWDLGELDFPYVFLDTTYCKARVGGDKGGKGARVCLRPWSSPPACPPTAPVRFWGARSGTPKRRTSGPSSCGACATADCPGPSFGPSW